MDFKNEETCFDSIPQPSRQSGLRYFSCRQPLLSRRQTVLTSCRFLSVLFLMSLICDAASTVGFMREIGAQAELNPAVRMLSLTFGHTAGPFIGAALKALTVTLLCLRFRRYTAKILLTGSVIYFFAAFYNLLGVYFIHLPLMTL